MGGEDGGAAAKGFVSKAFWAQETLDIRLEGAIAEDVIMSSSGSLERFRRLAPEGPRFADDMLGRSGELLNCQW